MFQGHMPGQCGRPGQCSYQYVIEADGSVFPCDFYCTDQWLLGNVNNSTLQQLTDTPVRQEFLNRVEEPVLCRRCMYRNMCHGGCTRQRNCFLNRNTCGHQKLLKHIQNVISRH
ncbi:MAG: SPASM domain-containing protein [Bulleidia sp.]